MTEPRHEECTTQPNNLYTMVPEISVIIPVYNAGFYLEQTLASIESQQNVSLQIVCVDDCSTDNSLQILKSHAALDNRYTLIEHSVNKGTGAALNAGLKASRGTYVQLVGNDDILTDGALAMLLQRCRSNDLDLLMYGVDVFADNPADDRLAKRAKSQAKYHSVGNLYPICSGIELLRLMVSNKEYRMTNSPQLVRRDLLENAMPWNIEGIRHEDMYYTYNLLLHASKCTLVPDVFYRYRIRKGSQEDGKHGNPHSIEEIESLLVSAYAMLQSTPNELLEDPGFSEVLDKCIYSYVRRCAKWYENLADEDCRRILHSPYPTVRYLMPAFQRARYLAKSNSFRLGRAFTAVPRLIKRAFKALRRSAEHIAQI